MKEKTITRMNRIAGLAMIAFGELFVLGSDNPFLNATGTGFILEGAGDLVSGECHYFSGAVLNYYFPNLRR
jgi:hypothetical protein